MPTSTHRKQRPARPAHFASEAILADLSRRLAIASGLAPDDEAGMGGTGTSTGKRPFQVDTLRALDNAHTRIAAGERPAHAYAAAALPGWLARAEQQAQTELRAWYARRGIPDPTLAGTASEPLPDPGEPQHGVEEEAAYWDACPRPLPQTREQQIVEFLKCRASVPYFVDSYLSLRHAARGVIPFRLWRWQGWLLLEWQRHRFSLVLKGRQLGVSELAAAAAFHEILFHATKTVLLISIGDTFAQVLLGRAATMLEHLPPWLVPETRVFKNPHLLLAVSIAKLNTTEMEFAHTDRDGRAHASVMASLPATQNAGRSRTASMAVLDEHAHQMWAEEIWGSVSQTTGITGRILSISTANGVGNIFYRLWDGMTREPDASGSEFATFLSWRRHPEHGAAFYAAQKRKFEMAGTPQLLHQEQPTEPGEAFIQTGLPVFDAVYLNRHELRIGAEEAQRRADGLPAWQEIDGLTVYEEPVAGHEYIIGADVAEGLEDGDFDDAVVVDRQTGYEVAALHGHWPESVYATKLDELGYRYNKALLAVERVNHGRAVLAALLDGTAHEKWAPATVDAKPVTALSRRVRYPNLYHHKDELALGQHEQRRPGWDTNVNTKPLSIAKLGGMLSEDGFLPRTRAALLEARIYAYDGKGGMGAPKGFHDDAVMARAIAVYLLSQPLWAQHALTMVRSMRERADAGVAKLRAQAVNSNKDAAIGAQRRPVAAMLPTRQLMAAPSIPAQSIDPQAS